MTTSETLGAVFPIDVEFVPGEQPSDEKFTGWANQTSAGLEKLAKAMGDLWGEAFTDNKLYVSTSRPPHIMNLARLIGPASAINPVRPVAPGTRVEYDVSFNAINFPTETNEISLRDDLGVEPPIDYSFDFPSGELQLHSSIYTALEAMDTGHVAFGNGASYRKTSKSALTAAGHYYVDTNGTILTYTRTPTAGYTGTQTFQTTMAPDMYDQATLNVIPDMNQSTSDGLCDVLSRTQDTGIPVNYYIVRTPYLVKVSRRDASGIALTPGDEGCPPTSFGTTERARLPYVLKASTGMNLNDGDMIPDGFIGLWDETAGAMVEGLTFYLSNLTAATDPDGFSSDYCVKCTGATLTANAVSPTKGSRYRLVTIGTTITETLSYQVRRFDIHDHSNRTGGFPIKHSDLIGKTILASDLDSGSYWGIEAHSPPSKIPGNEHPQYLCKYGWKSGIDAGQYDNAMMGDIFMAATQSNYTTLSSYNSNAVDSRKIIFGFTAGPSIYYDLSSTSLILDGNSAPDIKLFTDSGSGDIYIDSGDNVYVTSEGGIILNATGALQMVSDNDIYLQSLVANKHVYIRGGDSGAAGGFVDLTAYRIASVGGDINITAQNDVDIDATGDIEMDAVNLDMTASGWVLIDAGNANLTLNSGDATLDGDDVFLTTTSSTGSIRAHGAKWFSIPYASSAPTSPTVINGAIYYNQGSNRLYFYNSGWKYAQFT